MGIQINGNTNNINAGIGSLSIEDIRELDITGIATASNFKTGTSNVHSTGYECTNVNATGVITATSFVGSGANLTGISIPGGATNLNLNDSSGTGNGRIRIGAGQDLQIYHDGSHSWFKNTEGRLILQTDGDQIQLRGNSIVAFNGAASTEYLRISSNGNISINNSSGLSSTYSAFKHFSICNNLILNAANSAGGFAGWQNNAYLNSSGNWVRVNNDHATSIGTDDGNFYFRNAGAGTGTITWKHVLTILANGKIGLNNSNPTHPLHILNTSSTFNSASLIRGDTSTSGGGAYVTFTNTADSNKSAYFGLDGNGLFNLDAGAALVGTNGDEPIIFATNGNDEKVRIFGGTDNVLQIKGGSNLSITDYAPNVSFSGSYAGLHHDNHGNTLLALNASLNYSGTSGTHQWKQNNAHPTIGSAGMFIGGNGSSNNSNITFFRNGQGGSAGQTYAQDSWKFQIGSALRQNFNLQYLQRGYFKTDTNQQNANNFPLAASGIGGYAFGYQEAFSTSSGSWAHPYPDLVLGYHTGMRFGANRSYGGCRFYDDHPYGTNTIYMSIGNGNTGVHVVNSLSKGGGSFRIAHPHPSKKYTHDLVHSFIEGPQMDLIYRGKVDLVGGSATVNIDTASNMTDGTFVLLNRDVQCFTSNETGWTAVKGSVSGNVLTITAQDNSCTDTISWMVIGERQDDKIKSLDMTDDNGDLIVEPLTIEETHM